MDAVEVVLGVLGTGGGNAQAKIGANRRIRCRIIRKQYDIDGCVAARVPIHDGYWFGGKNADIRKTMAEIHARYRTERAATKANPIYQIYMKMKIQDLEQK